MQNKETNVGKSTPIRRSAAGPHGVLLSADEPG